VIPEFDRLGKTREPSGTTVTGIVPTNAYLCKDGKYVIIGGSLFFTSFNSVASLTLCASIQETETRSTNAS